MTNIYNWLADSRLRLRTIPFKQQQRLSQHERGTRQRHKLFINTTHTKYKSIHPFSFMSNRRAKTIAKNVAFYFLILLLELLFIYAVFFLSKKKNSSMISGVTQMKSDNWIGTFFVNDLFMIFAYKRVVFFFQRNFSYYKRNRIFMNAFDHFFALRM